MAKTSPGSGSRRMIAATASGIAPRCTGMCSAWATMRPSASKRAVEQSLRSLMFEEYAPRIKTAPISSATPESALAKTESVTGSSRSLAIALLQNQRAHAVDPPAPARVHGARGLLELDHGGPPHLRALAHLLAIQHRCLRPLAPEVRLPAARLRLALRLRLVQLRLLDGDGRDEAQVHQLHGLVLHLVAVALLVGGVKTRLQLVQSARLHRQLEGLPPVAQIRPAGKPWSFEVLLRRPLHLPEPALDLTLVNVREAREVRAHVVAPQVGDGEAKGGEHAARARDEDGLDAELFGEGAGVHPAGAAEGQQRELPGVEAALDAYDPQGSRHLRVRHPHDAERDLLRVQAEPFAQGLQRLLREISLQDHFAAQGCAVGE